ncbi:MAG TPA: FGGY-family carbohydrate kinase [Microvirga sp.]|jgi:xylulokinase|nr:FGGY-family carbohydrate kinase [Microvirga sp.]
MAHDDPSRTGFALACDIGGTSLRVGLVGEDGAAEAVAIPMETPLDARGWSEVAPDAWLDAFRAGCATLAARAPAAWRRVAAVAVCGMTRTQVLVDESGRAVRPALTWRDTRAGPVAGSLAVEGEAIDAFHPAARLAWVEAHEPDAMARARRVIEPKDYIASALTGRLASDPVALARLSGATRPGSPLRRFARLVPDLLAPASVVAPVRAGLPGPFAALEGRPVVMVSNDTWAAVLGLGALRPGYAYNISGTSEVFGLVADRLAAAPGLLAVDWGAGLHQLGGPSQNGAAVVPWLLALTGGDPARVEEGLARLLAGPRHVAPLLFLPFLHGERVPYWDPRLRGAFLGLGPHHGPTDLAWAVLEATALANRVILARAEAALGSTVAEIRLGGGAARNRAWNQIRADMAGRPVVVGAAQEPGLVGCAACAFTAVGRFRDLGDAQDRLARAVRRFEPDPERRDFADALFSLHERAAAATAGLSHGLSEIRVPLPLPGVTG